MDSTEDILIERIDSTEDILIEHIESALMANNGGSKEFKKELCRCDPSVGYTCEHCTIDMALRSALKYTVARSTIICCKDCGGRGIKVVRDDPMKDDRGLMTYVACTSCHGRGHIKRPQIGE